MAPLRGCLTRGATTVSRPIVEAMQTSPSADGTPIAWYDHGGSGPDLLLAHATGFCAAVWGPVVEGLLAHFRCVSYDMRGHGSSGSPATTEGWDWDRYAEDVETVIAAAGLQHPFGIGHSCGGASELLLEEARPGTFRALVLFEPVLFLDEPPKGPDPDRDLALRTRKRRRSFGSAEEAVRNFSSRGPFASLDARALEAYVAGGFRTEQDGSVTLRCDPEHEALVYTWASAHHGFTHLDVVECPTWIAHGSTSTSFSADHQRAIAERLPRGTFLEMADLGHFGPLEDPERFVDVALTAFAVTPAR